VPESVEAVESILEVAAEVPVPEAVEVVESILEVPAEIPVPEAVEVVESILEVPAEIPVPEAVEVVESILEVPAEIPVPEAVEVVELLAAIVNIANVNESESYSNQETLGDSIHQSINSSIIGEVKSNTNIINIDKNISQIIESEVAFANNANMMESLGSQNKLIAETNFDIPVSKPLEPEIIHLLDNQVQNITIAPSNDSHLLNKSSVSFSSSDLQEIINFDNHTGNHLGNTSSLNTNSEFSYTRKIKDIKQPNLINNPLNRNIRLNNSPHTKKKFKKQIELDEVDYLYNKLQDYSRYLTINITNYMLIITKAMEIIENYDDFIPTAGYGKKDVVIKAINRLVMIDLELGELDKRVFLSTLSNFIELIIMCSRRHIKDSNKSTKDNFNYRNDKIDDMVLASSGQIVFSLIDKLTTIILKNQYNAEKITHNIPTLTEILMLMADKYDYLTGLEKKNIVIQAMNVFIRDKLEHIIDLEQNKKQEIIDILQCVPDTIDLFIALQKQKYKINKKCIIKVKKSGCLASIFATKKSYEDD
jgi:hypothetical protein